MLAVALGAASSLERGRLDKALKFLQTGLRADPDAAALQRQYEGLKLLQKLVRDADEQLRRGYSNKALGLLDEAREMTSESASEFSRPSFRAPESDAARDDDARARASSSRLSLIHI